MPPKRKRGGPAPKPRTTYQRRSTKPPPQPKPTVRRSYIRRFWQPLCDASLLNLNPYEVDEECIEKIFFICSRLIEKHEGSYKETVAGRLDYFIWKYTLFPKRKRKHMHIVDELMKIAGEEIEAVSIVLKEIDRIKEKECRDVIANVAERDSTFRPVITLFYPLLLELASLLPVWIGKINETAPRRVGAIPATDDSVVEPGQYVAAFVLPGSVPDPNVVTEIDLVDIPSPHEEFGIVGSWILARVLTHTKRLYKIVDMDDVPYPHYCVERKVIIPLPLYRADPVTNPEAIFPVGAVVLALYKNTTCFFPAVVLETPKTISDSYTLCFRDLSNKLLWGSIIDVQQRYVIKYKEAIKIFTPNQRKTLNSSLQRHYT